VYFLKTLEALSPPSNISAWCLQSSQIPHYYQVKIL
jgi:hypothetical protein